MKELLVFLRPNRLEAALAELAKLPCEALTFAHVRGYGRQKERLDAYHDETLSFSFLPKVCVRTCVPDEAVEEAVAALVRIARTGRIGDGKILVLPLAEKAAIP